MNTTLKDRSWQLGYQDFAMQIALDQANIAAKIGEVPVGAVMLKGSTVLAKFYNTRESSKDPTAHAELLAIRAAAQELGDWRLQDCDLYVTLEPCVMCAGAIINARLRGVFYGANDLKAGAMQSLYGIASDPRLNHEPHVKGGLREQESAELLRTFFEMRRE